MFASLSDRLAATFKSLRGKGTLSQADVDATVREIRRALLDADVAVPVVRQFAASIRERALSTEVSAALNPAQQVVKIVHEELVEILGGEQRKLQFAKRPPTVIMLAGLQGAGKTTLAGKLAKHLREEGHTPVLVAADLQRPNAVTQLEVVAERAGVPAFAPHPGASEDGELPDAGPGDPVAVARQSIDFAKEKLHDVVIVDTAGRLGVDAEMMQQAADIRDAVDPDEVIFVIDAMTGQDAVTTAQAFADGVGITGVVLSKLDGDARGGAALSVASVTQRPILFASTGENLGDFEVFHPDRIASRILDMGDILTLIEQAEKAFDAEQAEAMAQKLETGGLTLEDFLQQLQTVKQMGSMKKLMGMMPGMAQAREQLENFDEREIDRIEAIVRSMTPGERENPKILNGSRRARIARGSGTTVTAVNQLIQRFEAAQAMMKQMNKGGGMPGMPGMPGAPGMGFGKKSRGRTAPKGKKKRGRSGNPAKRAQQEREAALREAQGGAPAGSAFGLDQDAKQAADVQLPPGFGKFLQ
ncbi:MAG TPA: signal recognition particle protein [Actinomycetales bacterium]|nr:signal recognition particle protein [Actinomycetales bacterium]